MANELGVCRTTAWSVVAIKWRRTGEVTARPRYGNRLFKLDDEMRDLLVMGIESNPTTPFCNASRQPCDWIRLNAFGSAEHIPVTTSAHLFRHFALASKEPLYFSDRSILFERDSFKFGILRSYSESMP